MKLHDLISEVRDAYYSDRKIAFYVAAGISKDCPTHLPLGEELKETILSGFSDLGSTVELALLNEAVRNRSLEEVCGVIQGELHDRGHLVTSMAQALDNDTVVPNHNHLFLAKSLHDGHLVVTTNYDAMVERAYQQLYGRVFPVERICFNEATFADFMMQSSAITFERTTAELGWLLKLHGTFQVSDKDTGSSVMTTLDRVGQGLPPTAEETLVQVLRNCHLFVLGYGCMDIDVVYPVLMRMDSPEPIWWIRHTDGKTEIFDYRDLRDELNAEEGKSAQDRDVQALNIGTVLCNRGSNNGGRVWQIKALTSHVVTALMAQIGGIHGVIMPCRGKERHWEEELRLLGRRSSHTERLLVLAKLAQACGPYKSDDRDIYELSNALFGDALERSPDNKDRARIYQETGWNKYRQDPEGNADEAVRFYDMAVGLLASDAVSWMSRVTVQGLKALAYRRARRIGEALEAAEVAWSSLPNSIRAAEMSPDGDKLRTSLRSDDFGESSDYGILGAALRRIAGVYDQCVSGPVALATAIRWESLWVMDEQETRVLTRARRLLESDRVLQKLAGEPIQRIQSENQLGLVCSKLGDGAAAATVHEESRRVAEHFGRWYEYAQALRNLALAEEVAGHLDIAIEDLTEAMRLFEGRQADLHATLWHLGRIRIKNKDRKGLDDIEKHSVDSRSNWHWKANDYALLAIGYFGIKGDLERARKYFASMIEQYPREGEALKRQPFRNQAYGIDNALANVVAATECLSNDRAMEALSLGAELASLREQLEAFRSEALQSLAFLGQE